MKYFKRYSTVYKTVIYYCQMDGWNYYCAEYKIDSLEKWVGCFYDSIEIDWREWEKRGELQNELEVLPQGVMNKMIECVI